MTTSLTRLWRASNGHCYYCGNIPLDNDMGVDHLLPRNRGGRTIASNVVPACTRCNSSKGAKTFHEYRAWYIERWEFRHPDRELPNPLFWGEEHLTALPLNFNPPVEELQLEQSLVEMNLALYGQPVIGFSGHRPERFPEFNSESNRYFMQRLIYLITHDKYTAIISGMALGFDTLVARQAINQKTPLIAAVPFPQQPSRWDLAHIKQWGELIRHAQVVNYCSTNQHPNAYQQRNEWIVDHCQKLFVFWDHKKTGGTWNCIQYARTKNLSITNMYDPYMRFLERQHANSAD